MRVILVASLLLLGAPMVSAQDYIHDLCQGYPPHACPIEGKSDWIKYAGGKCIKAFSEAPHLNFTEAEDACVGYGGHLVSMHDTDEMYQVVCAMLDLTKFRLAYWIGLKLKFKYENNLVFEWTDGSDVQYSNWPEGQPNQWLNNQDCVDTNYYLWGLWNDVNCSWKQRYVCSVPIQESEST